MPHATTSAIVNTWPLSWPRSRNSFRRSGLIAADRARRTGEVNFGKSGDAALSLADVLDARAYVACAALCAGAANAALVLKPGFNAALGLRFRPAFASRAYP